MPTPVLATATNEEIGLIIRLLRTVRQWSQEDLATKAGFSSTSSISGHETGSVRPREATIDRLLAAMELPQSAAEQALRFIRDIRGLRDAADEGAGNGEAMDKELPDLHMDSTLLRCVDEGAAEVARAAGHLYQTFIVAVHHALQGRARAAASADPEASQPER